MTNAEAWFDIALLPRKPEGSLGRTAQDGHLDSHTAPGLCVVGGETVPIYLILKSKDFRGYVNQNVPNI